MFRKLIAMTLALALCISNAAAFEEADISAMTVEELKAYWEEVSNELQELRMLEFRIDNRLMKQGAYRNVVVPQGTWSIGEDIPAGYWTISIIDEYKDYYATLRYGDQIDRAKRSIDMAACTYSLEETIYGSGSEGYVSLGDSSITLYLEDGFYIEIDRMPVHFSRPYERPSFDFVW